MKNRLLPQIGSRFYVMGILNLTPDSFSGDGLLRQADPVEAALAQAKQFAADGADILDLGAESTRPGAAPVSAEEECARLLPVLERLKAELPEMLISVDTYKAAVAEAALQAGAHMVNDIWGFRADNQMGAIVARFGAAAVLMHNRRSLAHTEIDPTLGGRDVDVHYDDITREVAEGLLQSVEIAHAAGLKDDQIILDPGIGFGKGTEQNLLLLKELDQLKALGYPLLLGVSRKSFIGYKLNLPPEERLEGSLAANAYGMLHGADIVRVHDVRQTVRVARMLEAILQA
ncbi:MAG TPA: dihydropteroate synthase [Anaerolineaceae bacterium]|nr:MAG: Dihydropteroate synthase [Anaerolineae bacterium 49_20]HAE84940.1 dihydropteroate synthase [Anaerolineaceae bacterium]